MPSITVADANVHYEVEGTGPGLILVHGTQGSGESDWGHLVDGFSGDRTVVRPDLSGSGKTTDAGGELTVEILAGQVAAAARAAVDGPVDMVGFSLGAVVAAAVAALEPGLVRRMVLVAGWPHTGDSRQRLMFELWRDLDRADFRLLHREVTLHGFSPRFLDGLGPDGIAEAIAEGTREPGLDRQIDLNLRVDIRDLLPRVAVPTLVVELTRDQLVPAWGPVALHEGIPDSRYTEIDSGHLVLFERPAELTEIIRGFVLD
ncbi:alpha/beta fold hydrolase [Actinomadura rudentiformis]|uniref:Alpha/beta hydrolase n=1 Tax=Actinomadura rudentiformis TaxID=359158 RepID=A0A6H9Z5Z3_9ACTN|nr:alpha/beta hydrolase [Actinomadura rudentiformis]KAB2349063.1 alpha/beta hydrolase [Actinomadura rudentiformis]